MTTSKPFSTISYNSDEFLELILEEFIRAKKISFFAFINHEPEKDESKAHKHLFIMPNGRVDTDQILGKILEQDPTNPTKPLKCLPPNSSKFDDWYYYAIHDKNYLLSKGQARERHYTPNQIASSDYDYLLHLVGNIDNSKRFRMDVINKAIEDGIQFSYLVMNGIIPVQQINQYERAYYMALEQKDFERNERVTHTPRVQGCDPVLAFENPTTNENVSSSTEKK